MGEAIGGRGRGDQEGVGGQAGGGRAFWCRLLDPTSLHRPPPPSTALLHPPPPSRPHALHGGTRRYAAVQGGGGRTRGGWRREAGRVALPSARGGKPQGALGATGGGEAPLLKPAARPLPALLTLAVQMVVSSCARGRANVGARARARVGARVRVGFGFGFGFGLGHGFGFGLGLGSRPG